LLQLNIFNVAKSDAHAEATNSQLSALDISKVTLPVPVELAIKTLLVFTLNLSFKVTQSFDDV
jgi:hypothetical protein